MTDFGNVDFSDAESKREAQEHPGQTQGDSPRDTAPNNQTVNTGRSAAPTTASKSEARKPEPQEEEKEQSYVWLANGEVLLADNEDLPEHAGAQNALGFWEKDGAVHHIVAVHPKETKIKENR